MIYSVNEARQLLEQLREALAREEERSEAARQALPHAGLTFCKGGKTGLPPLVWRWRADLGQCAGAFWTLETREELEIHIDRCGDVFFETFAEIEMLEQELADVELACL